MDNSTTKALPQDGVISPTDANTGVTRAYEDASLDAPAIQQIVQAEQEHYDRHRGSSALALTIAQAYIAINKIIQNADAETKAALLDDHDIPEARAGTSIYTPWIKMIWGGRSLDPENVFKKADGSEQRCWIPDRSMEKYHHVMETLAEEGVTDTTPKAIQAIIIARHGAEPMVRLRQKVLADRRQAAGNTTTSERQEQERGDLLREFAGPPTYSPIELPEDAKQFVAILFERTDDGLKALGIVDKDANAAFKRMAKAREEELRAVKAERKRDEDHERDVREARTERAEEVIRSTPAQELKLLLARNKPELAA